MKLDMLQQLSENAEELTEEIKSVTIRKEVGDLLVHVNKVHGKLIAAKHQIKQGVPSSLEDAFYKMTSELDKFIGEN